MCRFIDLINKARVHMASLTAAETAAQRIEAARQASFNRRLCPVLIGQEWFSIDFHPPHHNPKRSWAHGRLRLLLDGHEALSARRYVISP
jgi:hypothetical protein